MKNRDSLRPIEEESGNLRAREIDTFICNYKKAKNNIKPCSNEQLELIEQKVKKVFGLLTFYNILIQKLHYTYIYKYL